MKLYLGQIDDEKARRGFESRVALGGLETLYAVYDHSMLGGCSDGFVITSDRLLVFTKHKTRTVPWSDVTSATFTDRGFRKFLTLSHPGGRETYAMPDSASGRWCEAAIRGAWRGEFSHAAAPLDSAPPPAHNVIEEPAPGPLRLFHGREEHDNSRDFSGALGTLVIGPILLAGFWYGASGASPLAGLFVISFWLGLLLYPFAVFDAFRTAAKPGPRKVVYGVNARRVTRKVLRGAHDPLWSASEAPADLWADRTWERNDDVTFRMSDGDVVVDERLRQAFPPASLTNTETIKPTEFPDVEAFRAFARALDLNPGRVPSRPRAAA